MHLLFIGIRRSGNHAILGWLYGMMDKYNHFNDLFISHFTMQNWKNYSDTELRPLNHWIDNRFRKFNPNYKTIISLENQDLNIIGSKLSTFKDVSFKKVVLLRNPNNMMASMYHSNKRRNAERIIKGKIIWKKYAKEILRQTTHLKDVLFILYDKWVIDRRYRMEIARKLDLKYNEKNLNSVIGWARSSFDKTEKNAKKLDVLHRDKMFKNDQVFQDITNDQELIDLWTQIKTLVNYQEL